MASGTLLLLPQKLAQKFYIINFREKYGFTIGIVFVISTALLIVLLLSKIFHSFMTSMLLRDWELLRLNI